MSNQEKKKGKKIIVKGKVQRVAFRKVVKGFAKENNIYGIVQNLNNYEEDVQIICEGTKENINEFLDKLKELKKDKEESSKFLIKIDNVEIEDIKHLSNFTDFNIVRESGELGVRFDEGVDQIVALRRDFNTLHGSIGEIHQKYEKFSKDFETIAGFLNQNLKVLTQNQKEIVKLMNKKS